MDSHLLMAGDRLEWWVWEQLTSLFKDQKHFEQILFRANEQFKKDSMQADDVAAKIMQIDEALKDIATQIEKVIDFIATGDITKGAAIKKITNLQKQKAKFSKERQKLDVEQSLLLREVFLMEKIKETRLWWLEYSEKLNEKDKRKLVNALVEQIIISPRKYSKEQAQKDDEYGGGPDAGLEAKFNIEIIG